MPKLVNIESDTQLVFTRDNISKPALQLTWTSQNSGKQDIGGFKLTWGVRKNNATLEREPKNETSRAIDDWKPVRSENSGDKNWTLIALINLAEELKRDNTTVEEDEVWTTLCIL